MELLSAEKLKEIFEREGGVSQKGGQKDYAPDNSWFDKRKLENFYKERREKVAEERVRTLGSLCRAEWLPEVGRVKLLKLGKFSKSMGYCENQEHFLLPEEAMYLLDEASIQIWYKGVPISIQEAMTVVLQPFVPIEHYHVFAFFSRYGYILRRYQAPKAETYADKINLRKFINKHNIPQTSQKRKGSKPHEENQVVIKKIKIGGLRTSETPVDSQPYSNITTELDAPFSQNCVDSNTASGSPKDNSYYSKIPESNAVYDSKEKTEISHLLSDSLTENPNCSIINNKSKHFIGEEEKSCDNNEPIAGAEKFQNDSLRTHGVLGEDGNCHFNRTNHCDDYSEDKDCQDVSYSNWDFENEINFPDLSSYFTADAKESAVIKLKIADRSLIPVDIEFGEREYECVLKRNRDEGLQFSFGLQGCEAKRKARNWGEYKSMTSAVFCDDDLLLTSPVGHLWSDDVQPLIKPQQATSTVDILKKLQVIKNIDFSASQSESSRKIVYDGYDPSSKYKKTDPGKPQFRLAISRQDESPPSLGDIMKLYSESVAVDQVPLYWAVVDQGDVVFYSLKPSVIQEHVSLG